MPKPSNLPRCLELVRAAGRAGIDSDAVAAALGVARHHAVVVLRQAQQAGHVTMQRLHRRPALWFATGMEPEDRASVLQTGKPLTVKTRERLVLRHDQPAIVPPGVRITRCPTRWS